MNVFIADVLHTRSRNKKKTHTFLMQNVMCSHFILNAYMMPAAITMAYKFAIK